MFEYMLSTKKNVLTDFLLHKSKYRVYKITESAGIQKKRLSLGSGDRA